MLWRIVFKVGKLPKAAVVVNYMVKALSIVKLSSCAMSGVLLIEDAAESMGAMYQGRPSEPLANLVFFRSMEIKSLLLPAGVC